jgi:two-component system, chemotaxis family, sensor kinase CheA
MDPDFQAILETFAIETQDNLRTIDEALVVLEQRPDDAETLATIFRMAHTVKGNAASLGFPALAEFAHAFEEILDLLREGAIAADARLITLLLEAVDSLRDLVASALAGESEMAPAHRSLLERLVAAACARTSPPPATTHPQAEPGEVESPDGPAPHPRVLFTNRPTLRVDVERLDRMLDLVGEVAIERARMHGLLESASVGGGGGWLAERHAEADDLYAQIRELVLRLRMVPIANLFRQQVRVVRDVAALVGKQARLVLEGEDEEMDTAIVEGLKDPLTHMIRNAIDHGIERPEARIRAGKSPTGTVTLRARHDAGGIVVQIADNGAGLNRESIARRAREMKLAVAESQEDPELYALIFEPGFSTAAAVTGVSGRGVGMDVVMKSVKALRGTISIASTVGSGTTFTIRLPLTIAIIDGFAVTAANETYVVPLEHVTTCLELPAAAAAAKGSVIDVLGAPVPFFRLRDVFNLGRTTRQRESIVLLERDNARVGLAVDALLGVTQVVIKSPGKLLEGRPGLAGSTILGTGQVAFILDVPGLLRMAAVQGARLHSSPASDSPAAARSAGGRGGARS